jgi:rod shape-determining protein MreD
MRRILIPVFLGVLLITLQTTLLTFLPIQRIRPDIVLIFTLYLGLSSPLISGGILAFFMGYLMDLFSGNTFGLFTLSRPLLFYLAQLFKSHFYLEGIFSQSLFAFLFALVEGSFIVILLTALNSNPHTDLYPLFIAFLLPQSLFTGLITPFLFSFFKKGSLLMFPQEKEGIREKV